MKKAELLEKLGQAKDFALFTETKTTLNGDHINMLFQLVHKQHEDLCNEIVNQITAEAEDTVDNNSIYILEDFSCSVKVEKYF